MKTSKTKFQKVYKYKKIDFFFLFTFQIPINILLLKPVKKNLNFYINFLIKNIMLKSHLQEPLICCENKENKIQNE